MSFLQSSNFSCQLPVNHKDSETDNTEEQSSALDNRIKWESECNTCLNISLDM